MGGLRRVRWASIPSFKHPPYNLNFLSSSTIHTEIDDERTNGPPLTQEYLAPGPSLIRVLDPGSSYTSDDQLVQYPNPQGADVGHPEFASEILADAIPIAPISVPTFPDVFRNFDLDRYDKFTNEEFLAPVAAHSPTESWVQTSANTLDSRGNFQGSSSTPVPAGSDSPTMYNIPESSTVQYSLGLPPQSGPKNIRDHQVELQDAHVYSPHPLKYKVDAGPSNVAYYTDRAHFESIYPQSAEAPVASISRQTLLDINPGQGESYCGQSQYFSSGVTTKFKDNFINVSGPPVRRPRRSKDHRQQPYKQKGGTRRRKSPSPVSDVTSSSHDIAAIKGHPEHGVHR